LNLIGTNTLLKNKTQMECFICTESTPEPIHLGCACRSDSGFAHIDCMAKFIRSSGVFRRECQICKKKLTGRMLHYLNSYFTGDGELVCSIQELVQKLISHKIPIIRLPVNDQTCFRISTKYVTLSIAARKPKNVNEEHFFEVALIDTNDRVVNSSIKEFNMPKLIDHIQNILCKESF
jgi:hypothetical protein